MPKKKPALLPMGENAEEKQLPAVSSAPKVEELPSSEEIFKKKELFPTTYAYTPSPEVQIIASRRVSNRTLAIVLTAFILMATLSSALVTIYLIRKNSLDFTLFSLFPSPSPTSPPATIVSPTATPAKTPESVIPPDQQTYKNEKYEFEFEYPNGYVLTDSLLQTQGLGATPICGLKVVQKANTGQVQPSTICLSLVKTEKTPQAWLEYDAARELTAWHERFTVKGKEIKPGTLSVEDVYNRRFAALKVERQKMATSPHPKETQYLFKKDDLLFVLSVGWGGWDPKTGQEGAEEKNALEAIFRSFRFTGSLGGSGSLESCLKKNTTFRLSYEEALEIARESECIKEGNLSEEHFCNEETGTWWIDLQAEKPGCNPACVVDVVKKTAKVNWRCTGLRF